MPAGSFGGHFGPPSGAGGGREDFQGAWKGGLVFTKTALLVNPRARHGPEGFDRLRRELAAAGGVILAAMPDGRTAFLAALETALARGAEFVVIGGGDGTLALAASVLAATQAVLVPAPLGSGNSFAWSLGYSPRLDQWWRGVRSGRVIAVDLGRAIAGGEQRVFLTAASLGVSSLLVESLSVEQKRRWGLMAWALEALDALKETPRLDLTVIADTGYDRFFTRQYVVLNGSALAGPFLAGEPEAYQDGELVGLTVGERPGGMLRAVSRLVMAGLVPNPAMHLRRGRQFDIFSQPPLVADLDGEPWRPPPLRLTVAQAALRVLLPGRAAPRLL